jgi:hypothetical protein
MPDLGSLIRLSLSLSSGLQREQALCQRISQTKHDREIPVNVGFSAIEAKRVRSGQPNILGEGFVREGIFSSKYYGRS